MKKVEYFPQNVCIRLNRMCNLHCSFCLANNESEGLTTEQILCAIKYLKLSGVRKARLAGGEPTLRRDFIDIIKFCHELDMNTIIYSNLTDIDDVFDKLVQYPVSFTTSIHGNQQFHDKITQPGSYQSTFRNIKKLIACNKEVSLHTVLMNGNYKYTEYIIDRAIETGIKKISFQTLIPRGKGIELFKQGESSEDIVKKLNLLYPLKEKYKNIINIKFINLYEKNYYVLETDGCIYLQKENEANDIFIRRIIE